MKNVGSIDRTLRFILGAILIALPLLTNVFGGWGSWQYAVSLIGAVLVLTAAFRFCPAYTLFGVRTCKLPRSR
jgi:hypothetical protein